MPRTPRTRRTRGRRWQQANAMEQRRRASLRRKLRRPRPTSSLSRGTMATDPFRYPSSGPLLRLAFRWLVLDQTISSATDRKALDRFGDESNPEGVSAARRAELVGHLVEGLLGVEDAAVCEAV